jgi:hypothetical protein
MIACVDGSEKYLSIISIDDVHGVIEYYLLANKIYREREIMIIY